MGTLFTIIIYAENEAVARKAGDAAFARIAELELVMSDYNPASELMRLCREPAGKAVVVSADLLEVLEKSQQIAALSDGAFDVTIGPVVRLWRRARRTGEIPTPEMLAHARTLVGWRNLKLDRQARTVTLNRPDMQLDLGGIGKGFAADKAIEVLQKQGIRSALVAASGDIRVSGPPPDQRGWKVSIGRPPNAATGTNNTAVVETLLLNNAGVSTSGDTEQFVEIGGKRYSHIVDAHTGNGLTERLQVSVVAPCATDTDGFDTTVSILGVQKGLALIESQPHLAAIIVRADDPASPPIKSRRWARLPKETAATDFRLHGKTVKTADPQ